MATDTQFVIRKLILDHGNEIAQNHQWLWEKDRWKELVFCILTRANDLADIKIRSITDQLESLDLLDEKFLSSMNREGQLNLNDKRLRQFIYLLNDHGFSENESISSVVAIVEAASFFAKKYDGKVQLLFRRFGEALLKNLKEEMKLSSLSEKETSFALTYWLQNSLHLPLSLKDESITSFCKKHEITELELEEASDEVGINLALLDDLISMEHNK
jgi:hypothetical protein